MKADMKMNKNFSIFDPAISYEHREFYERIVSELNGIFPVCNQGESTAVEISETPTEQEQITELMKRVENFADELLEVTKKLFDQYYVAKEALNKSILDTTAYNKINTLDRNLLERTCDVRWWALETAFSDCISTVDACAEEAGTVLAFVNNIDELILDSKDDVKDQNNKEPRKYLKLIKKGLNNFSSLLGRQKLDAFIKISTSYLSENNTMKAQEKKSFSTFIGHLKSLNAKIDFACDRLEDINNSYTLYRDLIITDGHGNIIANSNKNRRAEILGLSVKDEEWFEKALKTKNGTEYFAQDLCRSAVEDRLSLVFSTAVRENSDENGAPIGTMGVFFDFQGEARIILEEYMPHDENGWISEGCYSMFTNEKGRTIASNDDAVLPVGENAMIPRANRNLNDGEHVSSYIVFSGVESAIFSAKTDGYLDYEGLGWASHVIRPIY